MKNKILLYIVLFLVGICTPIFSETGKMPQIFELKFEQGKITHVHENFPNFFIESGSPLGDKKDFLSFKEAITGLYSAVFDNNVETALDYFHNGLPNVLRVPEHSDGFVRILVITKVEDEFRIIIRMDVVYQNNQVVSVHDAQNWRKLENGRWSASSLIYQK